MINKDISEASLKASLWSDWNGVEGSVPGVGTVSVQSLQDGVVCFGDPICGYQYKEPLEDFLQTFNRLCGAHMAEAAWGLNS